MIQGAADGSVFDARNGRFWLGFRCKSTLTCCFDQLDCASNLWFWPKQWNSVVPMYNIFVTYTADAWDVGVYAFRSDRVLKVCTDEDLRERYGELDNLAIAELMSFPCLFAYEEGRGDEVRLGWLTKIKDRGYETRLTFEFEEGLAPF